MTRTSAGTETTDDRGGAVLEGPGSHEESKAREDHRTRITVLVALGANLVIAVAKTVGGLLAGSPALLSEAAHSVADSLNEVFLLAALRRSRRPADEAGTPSAMARSASSGPCSPPSASS